MSAAERKGLRGSSIFKSLVIMKMVIWGSGEGGGVYQLFYVPRHAQTTSGPKTPDSCSSYMSFYVKKIWNKKNIFFVMKSHFEKKYFRFWAKSLPKPYQKPFGHTAKNMKIGAKTRSKGSSNLSVGAQTLWSCSTHQFYNFWKFHQKIFIFSEVMNDFRFRPQSHLFGKDLVRIFKILTKSLPNYAFSEKYLPFSKIIFFDEK